MGIFPPIILNVDIELLPTNQLTALEMDSKKKNKTNKSLFLFGFVAADLE